MIVRNEESNLEACLSPIAHLFDEIVIVDTGSRDRTREMARKFTGIIADFPWCDDFSAARNESLRHATGDWIFWLDADDRIPENQVGILEQRFKGLGHGKEAYRMTTVCLSQYDCDGASHLSHVRLFRRDPRLHWQGRACEQLRPEFGELGFEVRNHPLRMEHSGHADGALALKKAQRDIRLLRLDLAADPKDPGTILHLAAAYARASNYAEARKLLQTLIGRESPRHRDWLSRAHELLMECSMKMGDWQGAVAASERAIHAFPRDIAILYMRAQLFFEMDLYHAGAELLLRLRDLPDSPICQGGTGEIHSRWAPILLADCWRHMGQHQQAIELLQSSLGKHPGDVRMLYSMGCCYVEAGQRKSLQGLRTTLQSLPNGHVFSLLLYIQDRLQHREFGKLDECFDRLIEIAPLMPYPRLLRLEYLRQTDAKLLDYLAAAFVENNWSVKQLHRVLLLSSAYRMASEASARRRARLSSPATR